MKCRVNDFHSPDAQVHRSLKSISERDTSLAQNPLVPLSIFRGSRCYIFFPFFFCFCRFNLSPIIHNTQFRRLTKPPSVCWYRPPPSGKPAGPPISSRFCFRDLLIWLNCIASADAKLIQEIAARILKRARPRKIRRPLPPRLKRAIAARISTRREIIIFRRLGANRELLIFPLTIFLTAQFSPAYICVHIWLKLLLHVSSVVA